MKSGLTVTAPDYCYLNQAFSMGYLWQVWVVTRWGEKTNSSQTATIVVVVIKQSLGSWSHMWSLSNVIGCGSTSLFGSRAGTHQGKGSVSRFGR